MVWASTLPAVPAVKHSAGMSAAPLSSMYASAVVWKLTPSLTAKRERIGTFAPAVPATCNVTIARVAAFLSTPNSAARAVRYSPQLVEANAACNMSRISSRVCSCSIDVALNTSRAKLPSTTALSASFVYDDSRFFWMSSLYCISKAILDNYLHSCRAVYTSERYRNGEFIMCS